MIWLRCLLLIFLVSGCKVSAGPDEGITETYGQSLAKHVEETTGFVDYSSWAEDRVALDAYIMWGTKIINAETYSDWERAEKISFWMNLYNALTIQAILDHFPVRSIREIEGVWDKRFVSVMGKPISLNEIEHDVLRKEFKEPRVHYALVCAARSCPPLRSELFTKNKLADQLLDQQQRFFSKKENIQYDAETGVLTLSALLNWYETDFIGGLTNASVSEWSDEMKKETLILYLRKNSKEGGRLNDSLPVIRYSDYDWALNEAISKNL